MKNLQLLLKLSIKRGKKVQNDFPLLQYEKAIP